MNKAQTTKLKQNRDESEGVGSAWLGAIINPFFLFQGAAEVFVSWLFTRPWRRLCLFLPAVIIVLSAFGLILYGSLIGRTTLQKRYVDLAEAELKRVSDEKQADATHAGDAHEAVDEAASDSDDKPPVSTGSQLIQQEESSAYGDMLFRRLMRLDDQNPRTRYMVAWQLARSDRIGQARQMMQEIAPRGARGFAPAHAWLAIDLLTRKDRTKEQHEALMDHLRLAVGWPGMSSRLLVVYANLLAGAGQRQEALSVMEKAAEKDPSYLGALSVMAKQLNVPKTAADSSARAKSLLREKIATGSAASEDFVQLMKVQLSDEEHQAALETGRSGLRTKGDNDELKYWCSESLRMMFRKSIRKTNKGVEMNLALLDAAIKEFPSNPFLAEDIAMLTDLGVEASPELKSVLENQLAKGQATAVAHLLLANQEIKAGRLKESLPHLELALKLAPSHPVTLNNLALALALTDGSQLERAEELIEKAIAINPRNAEFYDSQGEIRLLATRPLDAIESLEKAIGIDPSRQHTHELMVKAYRAAGSEDMARVHEKFLAADSDAKKEQAPTNEGE